MSYLSVQLFPAKTGLAWAAVQLAGRGPVLAGCLVSLSLLFFDLPPSLLLVFFWGLGVGLFVADLTAASSHPLG